MKIPDSRSWPNLEEILVAGKAKAARGCRKVLPDVLLQSTASKRTRHGEQVEHEFRYGVGGRKVCGDDTGRHGLNLDSVAVSPGLAKDSRQFRKTEPLAEEML